MDERKSMKERPTGKKTDQTSCVKSTSDHHYILESGENGE